jgi:predicted AlkP superfamily pyrophosphatase or phosphodiesterase
MERIMGSHRKIIAFALLAFLLVMNRRLMAVPPTADSRAIQHVVIISVDGLMPEVYLHPDLHGLSVPTLRSMAASGASSRGIQPIFPSVTYPSHATIATGCNPGTHGIVTNRAWDPLERNAGGYRWYAEDVKRPALWQLFRQHHLTTSLIGWPVTVGAESDLLVPDFWRANNIEDLKLLRAVSTPGLLNAVEHDFPGFSSRYLNPETRDAAVTDIAIHTILTYKPSLLMLHLIKVVYKEHLYGPFSREAVAAIEDIDQQVARLIQALDKAGILPHTAIVVLSDYGFIRNSTEVHPGVLLRTAGLITLDSKHRTKDWKSVVMPMDGTTYVYVKDPADSDTRRALLGLFQPLAQKAGSGISRVITHKEIEEMGGDPEAFLALEAADGFAMEPGYEGDYSEPSDMAGTHGLFPDRPEMYGSLIIAGPPIEKASIEKIRLIDIAPTVANWFGLNLEKAEGIALPVRLKPDASQAGIRHAIPQ